MLTLVEGNLLKADAQALVNTVNTVGVMGKGIALQFKKAFPEMFKAYESACKAGELEPGEVHVYDRGTMFNPRYIINLPTKSHWRGKSRIEFVQRGLAALVEEIKQRKIESVAIPPLGCGLGGLQWNDVYPLIETALREIPEVTALVYPPRGAPRPEEMVIRTERPEMTPSRANVIRVLSEYCVLGYELTLLEIQKLLYFLQESGEPLRLRFDRGAYGPYADNLRHVLHQFEGHFIQGFGDGKNSPRTPMNLFDEAVREAHEVSRKASTQEQAARAERVFRLIEGFESPYGMELLASVHWVATKGEHPTTDFDGALNSIHQWNDRKRRIMKPEHVRVAWDRLEDEGWLTPQ